MDGYSTLKVNRYILVWSFALLPYINAHYHSIVDIQACVIIITQSWIIQK